MEKQNEEKRNGHGGRRAGAGRPRTLANSQTIAIRIPDDVVQILSTQKNRSAYIIEAIRAYSRGNTCAPADS